MSRDFISTIFSITIIALAAFVTQRFFLPVVWAGILCIATWPMFSRLLVAFKGRAIAAALAATVISALLFIVPLAIGLTEAAREAPALAALVADANINGLAAPAWLLHIPLAGAARSEEHTSELQSRFDLVCRLLLEKKKQINNECAFDEDSKKTLKKFFPSHYRLSRGNHIINQFHTIICFTVVIFFF